MRVQLLSQDHLVPDTNLLGFAVLARGGPSPQHPPLKESQVQSAIRAKNNGLRLHKPPDHRHTQLSWTGSSSCKRTQGRTDTQVLYQVHYLPALLCYAGDKNVCRHIEL